FQAEDGIRDATVTGVQTCALPISATLSAQPKPAATQGLPPLIDRELLFGNPEIAGAQLSPDGKYLAFLKPWKDTRNVWVKKTGRSEERRVGIECREWW